MSTNPPNSAWAVFYIITHQINADVQFLALGVLPVVAGIANALIQARVGLGQTVETRHHSASASHGGGPLRLTTRSTAAGAATISRGDLDGMEMKAVPLGV